MGGLLPEIWHQFSSTGHFDANAVLHFLPCLWKIALSLIAYLYIFRIKRDIEQILKELLVTNNADDETTPDKDGNVN